MEEQIREILLRFSKEECTEQEIALLEKWYDRIAADRSKVQFLSDADEERLLASIRRAMTEEEQDAGGQMDHQGRAAEREWNELAPDGGVDDLARKRPGPGRIWWNAAIWTGLILLGGSIAIKFLRRESHSANSNPVTFTDVSTGYEEMKKIILPDSSIVWLNAATHLSYHPDFLNHREVRLTGEAFFTIKKDADHSFIVLAGKTSTQVLGTAFNVSAYPAAGQLRISLKSGRIEVISPGGSGQMKEVLEPGQLLIYDKEAGNRRLEEQTPGEMDSWTTGELLFYKTPLREAFAQIEARYGIHIVYDHAMKNQTITARFENTALEKVLEHLSFGWDLHFIRKKDTLHVR